MRLLFVLLLCAFSHLAIAQWEVWQPELWDESSISAIGRVNGIAEDSLGFLWFASATGLYRYDGSTLIRIELSSGLSGPTEGVLTDLYFDTNGILWIGSDRQGLYRHDPRTGWTKRYVNRHDDLHSIASNTTYNFFEDPLGDLWVSVHGEGLCRYDPVHDWFDRVLPFSDAARLKLNKNFPHMITDYLPDPADHNLCWLASLYGLVRWDLSDNSYTYLNPKEPAGIRAFCQDRSGHLWGTTWGRGLYEFNPVDSTWALYRCVDADDSAVSCLNASDICVLDDSTLLLASAEGLLLFNMYTKAFDTRLYGSTSSRPMRLFKDSHGNLWIPTVGEQMYVIRPANSQFPRCVFPVMINRVMRDPLGTDVFATSDDTLYRISSTGRILAKVVYDSYLVANEHFMMDMAFDRDGRLWVLDYYGLYRYDGRNALSAYRFPEWEQLASKGYYWRCFIDSQNICWIFAQGTGVWTVDLNTGALKNYDFVEGDPHSLVHNYSIAAGMIDHDGNIWGSATQGIFYFDHVENKFQNSDSPLLNTDGVPVGAVLAFAEDNSGRIYTGRTINNIGILNKGNLAGQRLKSIDAVHQLPAASLTQMLIDKTDRLWMSCRDGIGCYDPRSDGVLFYGMSNGFDMVSHLCLLADGTLVAANGHELVHIDPNNLPATQPGIQPVITAFRIFDRSYFDQDSAQAPYVDRAELQYSQNFFSFDFGAIDFANAEPKEFSYMLEGLDKDWNYPQPGRQYAAYTNVGGGDFVFRVRVRNPGEEWSSHEAQLHVRVIPPLWQRPWFVLAMLLLVSGCIVLFYRYRIREIKKKEALITAFNKQLAQTEMKALRAQMNPHFLFNTLNAIKLYVQKNDQENAVEYLTDFAKLIRQVLQNSAKPFISLAEELSALDLYIRIERMRFDSIFAYAIEVDKDVSPETVRIPPMLLQPYVENAIWHGLMHKSDGPGMLTIHVSREGKDLVCTIEDNGIGREAAARIKSKSAERNKSMGMQITKDRMDLTGKMSDVSFDADIVDLVDPHGLPLGTRVVLRISPKE